MISNGFNAVFQSECMQCRTLGKGSRFDFFDTAGNGNAGQRIVSSEGNTPQLREGTGKLYLAFRETQQRKASFSITFKFLLKWLTSVKFLFP